MLQARKLSKSVSLILVYLGFLFTLFILLSVIFPPIFHELAKLIPKLDLPELPNSLTALEFQKFINEYSSILSNVGSTIPSIVNTIVSTFSGALMIFTFFMMTFYLLSDWENLHLYLLMLVGSKYDAKQMKTFIDNLEMSLGGWVLGEIALMTVIGLMTYIGLWLLNIPYAIPLAVLAGLLEVIPNIGPTISAVPAVAVAFATQSPVMGLFTLGLYIVVQQLENNIIVPKIMSSAVQVSPLVTIVLLSAGWTLGNVQGAILSIPLFILARTVVRSFWVKTPLAALKAQEN
jgi:predicted PurR-regulated permease PerM